MTIPYHRLFLSAIVVFALAVCLGSQAEAALVYDNIGPPSAGHSGVNFDNDARADDFTLSSGTSLTGFTLWASGTLNSSTGWAIYNDNAGAVGSLVASGTDNATTHNDTGVAGPAGNFFQIDGHFDTPVALTAGTYWVSFRNGPWGSTGSSANYWHSDGNGISVGYNPRWDSNEASPSFPNSDTFGDLGFQLYDTAVPEPSSFVLAGIGLVGLAGWGIRRRRKA